MKWSAVQRWLWSTWVKLWPVSQIQPTHPFYPTCELIDKMIYLNTVAYHLYRNANPWIHSGRICFICSNGIQPLDGSVLTSFYIPFLYPRLSYSRLWGSAGAYQKRWWIYVCMYMYHNRAQSIWPFLNDSLRNCWIWPLHAGSNNCHFQCGGEVWEYNEIILGDVGGAACFRWSTCNVWWRNWHCYSDERENSNEPTVTHPW